MRLIDAKELFSKVGDIKPANSQQYHDITDFMNMITNQSTIKAIPIEVLEEIKDAIEVGIQLGFPLGDKKIIGLIDRKISEVSNV